MRVILAGFEGEDNSSKRLLDCVNAGDQKIYLKNDKMICVKQIIDVMEPGDRILAFGQKPGLKNAISVELQAGAGEDILTTRFPVAQIERLCARTCRVKLSEHAGTSYCNHLYYHVMREIKERQIDVEIVFLHIPMLKNIDEFGRLAETVTGLTKGLSEGLTEDLRRPCYGLGQANQSGASSIRGVSQGGQWCGQSSLWQENT